MRTLTIGTQKHTRIEVIDEPGPGGANHHYLVLPVNQLIDMAESGETGLIEGSCSVCFQKGPVLEAGINGIHNEDLIAIVIDRLQGFQKGAYECRENQMALGKLEDCLVWLRMRTDDREKRKVEGTSAK